MPHSQAWRSITNKSSKNALPVMLHPTTPAPQASPVEAAPAFRLSPSMSSKSRWSSTATWSSTMACRMDLPASRPRPASRAERLSRTHNVVEPRMFPLSTQASLRVVESLAAPSVSTALDSTAARLQRPSTTRLQSPSTTRPLLLTPKPRRPQHHQLPPPPRWPLLLRRLLRALTWKPPRLRRPPKVS